MLVLWPLTFWLLHRLPAGRVCWYDFSWWFWPLTNHEFKSCIIVSALTFYPDALFFTFRRLSVWWRFPVTWPSRNGAAFRQWCPTSMSHSYRRHSRLWSSRRLPRSTKACNPPTSIAAPVSMIWRLSSRLGGESKIKLQEYEVCPMLSQKTWSGVLC